MLGPLPDFGMIPGATVTVLRRTQTGTDALGMPTWEDAPPEQVENVLFQPSTTADLGAERPEGDRIDVIFHFPKTYTKSLEGCRIEYGDQTFSAVGRPQAYMADATPGAWNRSVGAVSVNG